MRTGKSGYFMLNKHLFLSNKKVQVRRLQLKPAAILETTKVPDCSILSYNKRIFTTHSRDQNNCYIINGAETCGVVK